MTRLKMYIYAATCTQHNNKAVQLDLQLNEKPEDDLQCCLDGSSSEWIKYKNPDPIMVQAFPHQTLDLYRA